MTRHHHDEELHHLSTYSVHQSWVARKRTKILKSVWGTRSNYDLFCVPYLLDSERWNRNDKSREFPFQFSSLVPLLIYETVPLTVDPQFTLNWVKKSWAHLNGLLIHSSVLCPSRRPERSKFISCREANFFHVTWDALGWFSERICAQCENIFHHLKLTDMHNSYWSSRTNGVEATQFSGS